MNVLTQIHGHSEVLKAKHLERDCQSDPNNGNEKKKKNLGRERNA